MKSETSLESKFSYLAMRSLTTLLQVQNFFLSIFLFALGAGVGLNESSTIFGLSKSGIINMKQKVCQFGKLIKRLNHAINCISNNEKNQNPCNLPFIKYAGMCLLMLEEKMTWEDGKKSCHSKGAYMVWFINKEEHEHVINFLKTNGIKTYQWYHIGLHKRKDSKIIWTNGVSKDYFENGVYVHSKTGRWYSSAMESKKGKLVIDSDNRILIQIIICRLQ